MNFLTLATGKALWRCAGLLAVLTLVGCSSTAVNWDKRVGVYSWDDALAEFGPPDRLVDEVGGVKTAEWIQSRGPGMMTFADTPSFTRDEAIDPAQPAPTTVPPKILKLSFTPDDMLIDWDRNY